MKVEQLLAALCDLPISARDMDICIDCGRERLVDMEIVTIVESHDDPTVIGYVIATKDTRQLELPFNVANGQKEKSVEVANERLGQFDKAKKFLDWMEEQTDFCEWHPSVKKLVHKKLIDCIVPNA